MNNKGQTTILFSLMIGILFSFTLTALEVSRIYMSKLKIDPCVHSMYSSILADYNEELFERYHLLFLDPTYGTGSEAVVEEKIKDYLETSLNGDEGNPFYAFSVDEVAVSKKETILSEDMRQLKQQIAEYEKTAGLANKAKERISELSKEENDIEKAATETSHNAKELDLQETSEDDTEKKEKKEPEDPREVLKNALKTGILAFVAPEKNYSKEKKDTTNLPSHLYKEQATVEKENTFQDIGILQAVLDGAVKENLVSKLTEHTAFADYVVGHFSNGVEQREDSLMKCEVEYILKGKDNDYANMEAVVTELTWWRMPINYAYLLTDVEKKSAVLTLATGICVATSTEPLIEVVKYLLLGCWAYGESLYEMQLLLEGRRIPYVKTGLTWYTDLKTLSATQDLEPEKQGLSYEDCLLLLLAKKCGNSLDNGYARILDVIQLNLSVTYAKFRITDCVGAMTIQGKISFSPMFFDGKEETVYDYYFEKEISYEE